MTYAYTDVRDPWPETFDATRMVDSSYCGSGQSWSYAPGRRWKTR